MDELQHEVIPFRGVWKGKMPMPTNTEQVKQTVDKIERFYINQILQSVTASLFHSLAAAGYPILDDHANKKDVAFVNEAIKSMLLKMHGQKHPLQEVAIGANFKDWFDPKMVVSKPTNPPKGVA